MFSTDFDKESLLELLQIVRANWDIFSGILFLSLLIVVAAHLCFPRALVRRKKGSWLHYTYHGVNLRELTAEEDLLRFRMSNGYRYTLDVENGTIHATPPSW